MVPRRRRHVAWEGTRGGLLDADPGISTVGRAAVRTRERPVGEPIYRSFVDEARWTGDRRPRYLPRRREPGARSGRHQLFVGDSEARRGMDLRAAVRP